MTTRRTSSSPRALLVALVTAVLAACTSGTPSAPATPDASATPSPLATTSEGLLVPPPRVDWRRAIAYGDHPAQVVDVYVPDDAVPSPTGDATTRPALVLVHGGGWTQGEREAYHVLAAGMADLGWVAATVDYRLAPGATHPAAAEDVAAALELVVDDLDLPLDRGRVALAGDSAGGHLTALVALDDDAPDVAAWVSWSGLYDLPSVTEGMRESGAAWVAQRLATYLGCDDPAGAACADTADDASPVRLASPGDPPALLLHSRDEIIPAADALAMEAALEDAGVRVRLELYDGRAHGQALLVPSQDVVREFLLDVLGLDG